MRKKIFTISVLLCSLLLSGSLLAQREIQFSYDNSGNMTSRVIYFPSIPPSLELVDNSTGTSDENHEPGDNNNADNGSDEKTVDKKIFDDMLGNQQIKIYPNPTMGNLVINIPAYQVNPNDRIDIVDMQGVLKKQILTLSESNTIDISSYPPATYIMLIYIGGETTQWKIIKQ